MKETWRDLYALAVRETDWSKMEERIGAVEVALKERFDEVAANPGGSPDEMAEIADIRKKLDVLREEVRHWGKSEPPSS